MRRPPRVIAILSSVAFAGASRLRMLRAAIAHTTTAMKRDHSGSRSSDAVIRITTQAVKRLATVFIRWEGRPASEATMTVSHRMSSHTIGKMRGRTAWARRTICGSNRPRAGRASSARPRGATTRAARKARPTTSAWASVATLSASAFSTSQSRAAAISCS
jgi:hypothetical protein